jgi:hypothetical protein
MSKTWEYRLETLSLPAKDDDRARNEATAALDALGAEGWEAVGFSPSHASSHGLRVETTRYVVLLKRSAAR